MGKDYSMENLGIEVLIGRKVLSASINSGKDFVILDTDKGNLYLTWVGDCCAQCFLANVSGVEFLVGATILSAEDTEWVEVKDADYEVIESMGTTIKTDKGTVTFESRVEHNGYYGGSIEVSDDEPMDQYSSPRDNWKDEKLKPLTDF